MKKCLIDNYSVDALTEIVNRSNNMAELIRNLGYNTQHGSNFKTVKTRLKKHNISTEHFKSIPKQRIITEEDVFCFESNVSQKTLRKFFLRRKEVEYKCSKCGIEPFWNGEDLTLALDHIDGNNRNNLIENLRWICPNCHSQTKTFAGKNRKGQTTKTQKAHKMRYCIDCGCEIGFQSKSGRCSSCAAIANRKVERPTKDVLENILWAQSGNFTAVAKIYGVTDNAVRKWCKEYSLPTHSKDYKL